MFTAALYVSPVHTVPSPCGAAACPPPPWQRRVSIPGPGPLYKGLDFRSWVLVSPGPHCLGDRAVPQSQGPGPAGTVAACAGHHGTKPAAGAGSCADQREDEAFPPSLGQAPCGLAVAASRVSRPSLSGWGLRRLSRGPRDRARGGTPAAAPGVSAIERGAVGLAAGHVRELCPCGGAAPQGAADGRGSGPGAGKECLAPWSPAPRWAVIAGVARVLTR